MRHFLSSPLSVGPIPSPIDPVQEEKAQATFEKLYQTIEERKESNTVEKIQIFSNRNDDTSLGLMKCETEAGSQDDKGDTILISLADKPDTKADTTANKAVKDTTEIINKSKSENVHVHPLTPSKLPPLEDPSIILLSPSQPKRIMTESIEESNNVDKIPPPIFQSDEEIETLAEEVKHIKEDKAVEFLKEELKDKIVDMIAYQKHIGAKADLKPSSEELNVGQSSVTNHFLELKQKQRQAQKEFHQKLLCELEKDWNEGSSGETRNSAVAEALGTKFEVKVQKNPSVSSFNNSSLSHSKSSHQVTKNVKLWFKSKPLSQQTPKSKKVPKNGKKRFGPWADTKITWEFGSINVKHKYP